MGWNGHDYSILEKSLIWEHNGMKWSLLLYFREVSNMRTQWDETNNLALDRLDRLKGKNL